MFLKGEVSFRGFRLAVLLQSGLPARALNRGLDELAYLHFRLVHRA